MPFPLSYLIFITSSKKTVLLIPDHESQETAHFLLLYSWGCSKLLASNKASNHIYMECTSLSALHIFSELCWSVNMHVFRVQLCL